MSLNVLLAGEGAGELFSGDNGLHSFERGLSTGERLSGRFAASIRVRPLGLLRPEINGAFGSGLSLEQALIGSLLTGVETFRGICSAMETIGVEEEHESEIQKFIH